MLRGATGITLQPHQILRQPRNMHRMLDPHHIWNVVYNVGSNKHHPPTWPNTAPASWSDRTNCCECLFCCFDSENYYYYSDSFCTANWKSDRCSRCISNCKQCLLWMQLSQHINIGTSLHLKHWKRNNINNNNNSNNKNTSLQQVQHWEAKHQTIRVSTPQKLKLSPRHLQQQRRRQQQKHKPPASPTMAGKAANHKSMNTAESETRTMTSPTDNDDDTNKNTSLQQVQHWEAKHQTIRAATPQKLKLPPWHLQQQRRRQQQKHKPPASPTMAGKAANHKSMNTTESVTRTMTSPTETTRTTTTRRTSANAVQMSACYANEISRECSANATWMLCNSKCLALRLELFIFCSVCSPSKQTVTRRTRLLCVNCWTIRPTSSGCYT